MATMYPGQVSAVQVGSFFVKQYYEIIQQTPQVGYQFYSDASTVIRIDGDSEQTATSAVQIHNLLTAMNFTSIEIKTLHAVNSWNRGVLVMVTGFVQMKEYNSRRKYVQTFFLAPQEKGYFVLNDIFQLFDEEPTVQPSGIALAHDDYQSSHLDHENYESNPLVHENYESSSNVMNNHVSDPALRYTVGEEIQATDYVSLIDVHEHEIQTREYVPTHHVDDREYVHVDDGDYDAPFNEEDIHTFDEYSIPELHHLQQHQYNEVDDKVDEIHVQDLVASFPSAVSMSSGPPASTREFAEERPKQTYASILLAKAQPGNFSARAAPVRKITPVVADVQVTTPQQAYPEDSTLQTVEEFTAEDEVEVKSVYVGNLSSSMSASDLEHEFKNFGRLRPNGISVRSRKDSGGFYAFVEFEDIASVQNALQASPVLINGRQIYVEERKPNSGISRVGGRRGGRGRGGGYQADNSRGRFANQGYSSNRSRGNRVLPHQERGILGSHGTRNGHSPSESSAY